MLSDLNYAAEAFTSPVNFSSEAAVATSLTDSSTFLKATFYIFIWAYQDVARKPKKVCTSKPVHNLQSETSVK